MLSLTLTLTLALVFSRNLYSVNATKACVLPMPQSYAISSTGCLFDKRSCSSWQSSPSRHVLLTLWLTYQTLSVITLLCVLLDYPTNCYCQCLTWRCHICSQQKRSAVVLLQSGTHRHLTVAGLSLLAHSDEAC